MYPNDSQTAGYIVAVAVAVALAVAGHAGAETGVEAVAKGEVLRPDSESAPPLPVVVGEQPWR